MKLLEKNCRIALVQGTPVLFDRKATIDKVVEQIREAGKKGAQLIVFPESYVPCYPYGMTFGFTVGSRTARAASTGSATMTTPSWCPARTPSGWGRRPKRWAPM